MNPKHIKEVEAEMDRLRSRIRALKQAQTTDPYEWHHPKETGAVRRASMDLTRALARLRSSAQPEKKQP